jgi:uracil-DNA glycosylase
MGGGEGMPQAKRQGHKQGAPMTGRDGDRCCSLTTAIGVYRQVVRKTFTDFKRTHQDGWEQSHRLRFTPDELDALSDVLISPHYYA